MFFRKKVVVGYVEFDKAIEIADGIKDKKYRSEALPQIASELAKTEPQESSEKKPESTRAKI